MASRGRLQDPQHRLIELQTQNQVLQTFSDSSDHKPMVGIAQLTGKWINI
jgi:hypothetical protein